MTSSAPVSTANLSIGVWRNKRRRECCHSYLNLPSEPEKFQRAVRLTHYRSGELNAKNRELMELQALAQRRLKNNRANFADGMKAAKEVKKDLEWTQKRVK